MATQWNTSLTERSAGFTVTAAEWNKLVQNHNYLGQVAPVATQTSDVTINTTTVGAAVQIVALSAATYLNVPHMLEFYCPAYNAPAQETRIILRDSTTVIGTIGRISASADTFPLHVAYPITPSAASHTYNIAAWLGGAGSGTMNAGTGGTAGDSSTDLNIWMHIYRLTT